MRRWTINSILLLFCLHFALACSQNSSRNSGDTTQEGTSDRGGGGNLIDGKPIDFYAKDITLLPEYRKFIEPIDSKLSGLTPAMPRRLLRAAALAKTWYLVPVPLKDLPAERIGAKFKTTQGAIQTDKEVFITTLEWEKNSEQDRAMLLMHEIVMAYFRFKFSDLAVHCSAFDSTRDQAQCRQSAAKLEGTAYGAPVAEPEDFLSAGDYESIRHVSEWLYSGYQNLDRDLFILKLSDKNFDPRVFNKASVSDAAWEPSRSGGSISVSKLVEVWQKQEGAAGLPRFCAFDRSFPMRAKRECAASFTLGRGGLSLTVDGREFAFERDFAPSPLMEGPSTRHESAGVQGNQAADRPLELSRRHVREGQVYFLTPLLFARIEDQSEKVGIRFWLTIVDEEPRIHAMAIDRYVESSSSVDASTRGAGERGGESKEGGAALNRIAERAHFEDIHWISTSQQEALYEEELIDFSFSYIF